MRLIDADALCEQVWRESLDTREKIEKLVLRQPTIEAEPVRHGRWMKKPAYKGAEFMIYTCSECGEPWWFTMKYCGNCGAKMDMEEE